jgi:hypothetical protein
MRVGSGLDPLLGRVVLADATSEACSSFAIIHSCSIVLKNDKAAVRKWDGGLGLLSANACLRFPTPV